MPIGPKGERRPRDIIGTAVKVAGIATGEIPEDIDPTASRMGQMGGRARAAVLTPERRRQIAQKAARTRWGVRKPVEPPPPLSPQQEELIHLVRALPLPRLEKQLLLVGARRASSKQATLLLEKFQIAIDLIKADLR